MREKVTTKQLEAEDLQDVARVHIDSFPDSALSKLGIAVVERYYLWQLIGPHKKVRAMGAYFADECVGFSFSGIFNGSTSGFVRGNRSLLVRSVLRRPALLLNPLFFKRLSEGSRLLLRFGAKKRSPSTGKGVPNTLTYGILSIAVSPRFQKLGIGQLLMLDAEEEAQREGIQEICLTVHPTNDKAVRFYERLNWRKLVTTGAWNGAMTKILN